MPTVTLEQAQSTLAELIHRLAPGEELVITEEGRPVARLVGAAAPVTDPTPRRLGAMRGTVLYMAPDFDAPLDDFKDHTE